MARSSELEIWQHLGGLLWELLLCNAFCGSNPALSARIVKKPPIRAVFFRLLPRVNAGSCLLRTAGLERTSRPTLSLMARGSPQTDGGDEGRSKRVAGSAVK